MIRYYLEFSSTYQKRRSRWASDPVGKRICVNGNTGRVFAFDPKSGHCIPAGLVYSGKLSVNGEVVSSNKNAEDLARTWTRIPESLARNLAPLLFNEVASCK